MQHTKTLKHLVQVKVILVSQDIWTAIMHAAKNEHEDIVKALIEAGADVNAMDSVRLRF
jgi:ankyrin repeat protein